MCHKAFHKCAHTPLRRLIITDVTQKLADSPVQPADPKATKKASPPAVDPFAAGYLREVLGDAKWNIFSARLFERRLTGPRRSKKPASGDNGKVETTASLIDFLCKAEAVKEVLRTYVP